MLACCQVVVEDTWVPGQCSGANEVFGSGVLVVGGVVVVEGVVGGGEYWTRGHT